jgi:hypothetical protein
LAAVALANKMARIAWKLMVTGENYTAKAAPAALENRLPPRTTALPLKFRRALSHITLRKPQLGKLPLCYLIGAAVKVAFWGPRLAQNQNY